MSLQECQVTLDPFTLLRQDNPGPLWCGKCR